MIKDFIQKTENYEAKIRSMSEGGQTFSFEEKQHLIKDN